MKLAVDPAAKNTHEVLNQAPPLSDYNLFTTDRVLAEAVDREGARWARPLLAEFGERVGSEEAIRWGFQANENPPVLRTHDRFGNRIDEVEFHPAWHEVMRLSVEHGLATLPWADPKPGAHVARAALMYLASENEAGHACPVSMTYSAIPALRKQPRSRARMGTVHSESELRSALPAGRGKIRRAHRHGDDGKAGRLGCAREYNGGRAGGRRRVSAHRPQVVLFGADVRCFPGVGASARRVDLFSAAALDAGWRAQPVSHPDG